MIPQMKVRSPPPRASTTRQEVTELPSKILYQANATLTDAVAAVNLFKKNMVSPFRDFYPFARDYDGILRLAVVGDNITAANQDQFLNKMMVMPLTGTYNVPGTGTSYFQFTWDATETEITGETATHREFTQFAT